MQPEDWRTAPGGQGMSTEVVNERLTRRDYGLLALFCCVLFGFGMVSGRPLSLHEAVLPQSARSMLADGDWIVPKKGDTPWLESPPLPQWITVSVASVIGRCDEVWIVRLPAALVATLTVFLVGWMASVWFGRTMGLLAGFMFATTCQFTRYAWMAEDEIYLCFVITACIAAFVKLEFATPQIQRTRGWASWILGGRPAPVILFFVTVGMTNLVKGLAFGMVMAGVPMFLFLMLSFDWKRLEKYVWIWGAAIVAVIAAAWPLLAYYRYADVVDVWQYDLGGRLDGSYVTMAEPIWYYPVNLLWMVLPWTFIIPVGMKLTASKAWKDGGSAERFLWCWAIGVPLVFSLPHGKHHHYLLSAVAPWSIIGSHGLVAARQWFLSWPEKARRPVNSIFTTALPIMVALWFFRDKVPGPDGLPIAMIVAMPFLTVSLSYLTLHQNARLAAGSLFVALAGFFCLGNWVAGGYVDRHRQDVEFLQQVQDEYGGDGRLLVDMEIDPLVGFLHLFYLDDGAVPLHNLSFAVDSGIDGEEVLILTLESRISEIEELGQIEQIKRGWKPEKRSDELRKDQLSLYRLTYGEAVKRVPRENARVSPMQAMLREPGPDLRRL